MARPACKPLLGALFVAAAGLVVAAGMPRAQEGTAASARFGERAAAVEARRVRIEQHQRMARAEAHASMPDTMYASTPDPSTPPHPFPLDVGLKSTSERAGPPRGRSARSAIRLTHRIGLFPSAADALGRQGFARIINRSDSDGEVNIVARDDAGTEYGPVTLAIAAGETKHFNSKDLETGNAGKGLDGATGPPGEGAWRLALSSTLDLQVLSYIRTSDGFLTSMHGFVARTEAGQHRVAIFNPGKNANQVSRLRLINPGAERTEVRIEGIDDAGRSPGEAVVFTLDGGAARTLSARELESGSGAGVTGGLGTGKGKWRLVVSSDEPIEVLNTLSTPTGHLTNLSTVPGNAEPDDGGTHRIGLFPSAADALGRQGFARIINRSDSDGEVNIVARDDAGTEYGPVTLAIAAGETKHFNSKDLETGNAGKGLDGATGPPGEGAWRLALSSTLDLQVLSYIRTSDGFLTSMHGFVARTEAGQHRVAIFNPGKNANQVSRLRLINPGAERTEVRIEGIDDAGRSPGEAVVFTLDGGAARTLSARELESGSGAGVTGGLGTGKGKWRLVVSSDEPIEVLNTLSTPTGHLTNLSTVPGPAVSAESAADVFAERISGPIVQAKCIGCHVEGGIAGATRLLFVPSSASDHEARNLQVFEDFLAQVEDGADYVLNKIQGALGHGGGVQVAAGTTEYEDMERFLRLLGEEVSSAPITPQTLFDTVRMAPTRKTLRRAALIFAGRNPTDEEYAAAQGGADALRAIIRGLMTGPEFHEFLIRASNDRLLIDRISGAGEVIDDIGFVDFTNESFRRAEVSHAIGDIRYLYDWNDRVQHGARRAPLELIAHVVENDLPYTEILTADYIMANPWAAEAYGAPTRFTDPDDVHEYKPSRIVSYYRKGQGFEEEYDPVLGTRILDPGPLATNYPHAGILNTTSFLRRYPTTATNRNRARSRWTYYHFLGLDIEKSASRTTDPDALTDTNNPTMFNPACTVCHRVLDPVAGAFQNYGDGGSYRDQWGGLDSLDGLYKSAGGEERAIQADSWENRETLTWSMWLEEGMETLRVIFANDFYDAETGDDGFVYLDRIRVKDLRGNVHASQEFEDMEPPFNNSGHQCGEARRSPRTGRNNHLAMWNGYLQCALYVDVRVPANDFYRIEIVAWADQYEQYGENRFAELAVAANAQVYHEGDTWYRDMRAPGFAGELAPNKDNSVQWLARRIVADERFAEATVKFWWPAILGGEVAEPPEEEDDVDFEGLLLAANSQAAEVTRLAWGFRRGFRGGRAYNLKDLLVELVLSKWFRADAVKDANLIRQVALRDAGAKRLLTPEELARKTAAITGVQWRRTVGHSCPYKLCEDPRPHALTQNYRLLYGGIDSDGITERARDITSVMAGVAKRHAAVVSCPVVMREFFLLPEAERRLFAGIDQYVTPSIGGTETIRGKLVELHDKLLGVQVTPYSADVEAALRLFVDVMERGRGAKESNFRDSDCYRNWGEDLFFFEGILDDAIEWHENEHGGYYGLSDRADDFMDSIDWSDPHYAAQAWAVVMAYLLTDYRYLYL